MDLAHNLCAFDRLLLKLDFWKLTIVLKQQGFNEKSPYFIFEVTIAWYQKRWLAQLTFLPDLMKSLFKVHLKISNAHMLLVEILTLSQKS